MSIPAGTRVFVFGGAGTLGSRVVSLLRGSMPRGRVVAVARTSGDLQVDITAPGALPLRPGDVVVDAVGPFLHHPAAIVQHCLQNGAHYLDLSESAEFHDLVAAAIKGHQRHSPIVSAVVHGCSTVPAMIDALMPPRPQSSRTALLSVGSRNDASAPLLYGLLRPVGRPHASGRWWHDTCTRELLDGRTRRYGSHPAPFAGGRTKFYCGLDHQAIYWPLLALSVLTRRMSDAWLYRLCQSMVPLATLAGRLGTPRGSLRLEQQTDGKLTELIEVRAAKYGLMIPALPAAWAARALVERNDVVGPTPLSDLVTRAEIFASLRSRGYTVDHVQPDRPLD